MTALTKATNGGAPAAAADFADPFAAAGAGAGSTVFIKFIGASGDFLYGQDEEEMPHGTQMAADIINSQWTWTFWWEGEVLESITTPVAEAPKAFEDEPDFLPEKYDGDMSLEEIRAEQADRSSNFMDGWSCQAVLGLREIGGEGTEYTLKLNAGVSLNAFRALLNSFSKQYKLKRGLVPIVEISARSYKSKVKGVGKRYAPSLKIVDWKSEEELMEMAGDDPEMYDDEVGALPPPDDASAEADAAETEATEEAKPRPRPRGRRGNYSG